VINVLSDFSILALPFPVIYRLQMPWNKKWRISAVFAVGLFACVTSVIRLAYSVKMIGMKDRNPVERQLLTNKIGLWAYVHTISISSTSHILESLPG
jgi:hypothetical protein